MLSHFSLSTFYCLLARLTTSFYMYWSFEFPPQRTVYSFSSSNFLLDCFPFSYWIFISLWHILHTNSLCVNLIACALIYDLTFHFVYMVCLWVIIWCCVDILFFTTFHLMALAYTAYPWLNQLLPWECKMVVF